MLFPSIQFIVILFDGPHTEYYGFPLPWNGRFIAGSLVKDIFFIPLLFDLIFYGVVSYFMWRWFDKWSINRKPIIKRLVTGSIWVYGVLALSFILMVLSIESFYHGWYDYNFEIINVNIDMCV